MTPATVCGRHFPYSCDNETETSTSRVSNPWGEGSVRLENYGDTLQVSTPTTPAPPRYGTATLLLRYGTAVCLKPLHASRALHSKRSHFGARARGNDPVRKHVDCST